MKINLKFKLESLCLNYNNNFHLKDYKRLNLKLTRNFVFKILS